LTGLIFKGWHLICSNKFQHIEGVALMAEYSALKSDFIERTSKAYGRFQRENIPLSAMRLGIKAGSNARSTDMDQIIGRYLRQTD
jgi:hypothetical protein